MIRLRFSAARFGGLPSLRDAALLVAAMVVVSASSFAAAPLVLDAYVELRVDSDDWLDSHLGDLEGSNNVGAALAGLEEIASKDPGAHRRVDPVDDGSVAAIGNDRIFIPESNEFVVSGPDGSAGAWLSASADGVLTVRNGPGGFGCAVVLESARSYPNLEGMRVEASYKGGRKAWTRIPPPSVPTFRWTEEACGGSGGRLETLEIDAKDRKVGTGVSDWITE